ncbi:Hypothetical predicted protein [Paramuricea clavata]|uniref:Uncharacterized protein n=1 Tax=Paramuricea clavata TaxID=317549 RepID=A0A7D9DD84_PARCT|nr:Hypothetical predicted protein [Paramuricea clavata]
MGESLVRTLEEKDKSIETTSRREIIDIKNNTDIDKESDAPNCSSAKDHNKNTHVIKETISNELKQREKQPKSNNTDHCAKTNEKKALANVADGEGQAISSFGAVDRKYCKYRL